MLESLTKSYLIEVNDGSVIVLNPETSSRLATCRQEDYHNYKYAQDGKSYKFDLVKTFQSDPKRFLEQLGITARGDDSLSFQCPVHNDTNPSVAMSKGTGQWMCHGCGAKGNLWTLGSILFHAHSAHNIIVEIAKRFGVTLKYQEPYTPYADLEMQAKLTSVVGGLQTGMAGVEAYDYFKPDGTIAYRKFRVQTVDENGDTHKRFQIFKWDAVNKQWAFSKTAKNKAKLPKCLYRYPTAETEIVLLCEGEKDVHSLEREYPAEIPVILPTTTGSAHTWDDKYADWFLPAKFHSECLGVKRVYVFPDADGAGQNYVKSIQQSFTKRGIRVVTVDLNKYKDITDYLEMNPISEWSDKHPLLMAEDFTLAIDGRPQGIGNEVEEALAVAV